MALWKPIANTELLQINVTIDVDVLLLKLSLVATVLCFACGPVGRSFCKLFIFPDKM